MNIRGSIGPSGRTVLAAGALTAGLVGVIGAVSMTGPAKATQHESTPDSIDALPPLTLVTVPPLTLLTIPPFTFVTVPGDSTTTAAETTTTETTTTTTTTETTTTTDHAPTTLAADGPSQPSSEPEYTVEINLAHVNCDGTIHVEYATTADPAPAAPANHIVMYNPTTSPAAFTVVETADNAPNGSFAFDGPGAPDLTYRVFVIGLFDPANPDGPKAIDQADVVLVDGC